MLINTLYELDRGWTERVLGKMSDELGISLYYPSEWAENPINTIVKSDELWETFKGHISKGLNGKNVLGAQVICQQAMWHASYDALGPEGDNQPKTLRKLWYAGHKDAIQHISARLNVWRDGSQMDDRKANSAMCATYADFVETGLVTYLDLFVKDGSRQFEKFHAYNALPKPLSNIVFCIEKDAAYEDCVTIGRALGARVALSGSGKMGRAGTERWIRECLSDWFDTDRPGSRVNSDNPVYLLVISDWDYDGEAVIAPTFVQQMRRYIPDHLLNWTRVGIRPAQVEQMGYTLKEKAYQVKFHVNSAYSSWCREKAVFMHDGRAFSDLYELLDSMSSWDIERVGSKLLSGLNRKENAELAELPESERSAYLLGNHNALKALYELFPPLGYELDALKRVEYASIVVEGLLTLIEWDTLIDALSEKAWAQKEDVVNELVEQVLAENDDYQDLEQHIADLEQQFAELMDSLRSQRDDFADGVRRDVEPLVSDWIDDERITDDDPDAKKSDLVSHLQHLHVYEHWQPFKRTTRERKLAEIVNDEEQRTLDELKTESISFERVSFAQSESDD